jgi:hypothetical protein
VQAADDVDAIEMEEAAASEICLGFGSQKPFVVGARSVLDRLRRGGEDVIVCGT